MKQKISRAVIRRMSYQERLNHYHSEKNELFYKIRDMTTEEISQAHADLRDKWMI